MKTIFSLTRHNCLWAIFLTSFFVSCEKLPDKYNPIMAGHGGSGIAIPESPEDNTFESVEYCFAYGANGVELDIQQSQDNKLYAYHDSKLPNGRPICDLNQNELSQLDNPPELLENLVKIIPDHSHLIIDPKIFKSCYENLDISAMVNDINQLAESKSLSIIYSLSNPNLILPLKNLTNRPIYYFDPSLEQTLDVASLYQLEGIILNSENINSKNVQKIRDEGYSIIVDHVRSRFSLQKTLNHKISIILVDRVPLITNY